MPLFQVNQDRPWFLLKGGLQKVHYHEHEACQRIEPCGDLSFESSKKHSSIYLILVGYISKLIMLTSIFRKPYSFSSSSPASLERVRACLTSASALKAVRIA